MYLEKSRLKTISTNVENTGTELLPYNIPLLIEKLKKNKAWKDGEITSMVLHKSQDKQIVIVILPEGAEVVSHQVNESVTFKVLEGKLNLQFGKEFMKLEKDEMFKLEVKVKYVINSLDVTALLLTQISEK